MQAGDIQQWQESYPSRDTQIFQKLHSNLKILGTRRIKSSTFHTVDPRILGAMVQKLVVHVTWHLGFEHPCPRISGQTPLTTVVASNMLYNDTNVHCGNQGVKWFYSGAFTTKTLSIIIFI